MKGLPHKKQATVRFQPMPPPNAQWRVQQCGQVQQAALQSPPTPRIHTNKLTANAYAMLLASRSDRPYASGLKPSSSRAYGGPHAWRA